MRKYVDPRGDGSKNKRQKVPFLRTQIADTIRDGLKNRRQKVSFLSTQIADTIGDGLKNRRQKRQERVRDATPH